MLANSHLSFKAQGIVNVESGGDMVMSIFEPISVLTGGKHTIEEVGGTVVLRLFLSLEIFHGSLFVPCDPVGIRTVRTL